MWSRLSDAQKASYKDPPRAPVPAPSPALVDTDARIATYLDGAHIPPAPTSTSATSFTSGARAVHEPHRSEEMLAAVEGFKLEPSNSASGYKGVGRQGRSYNAYVTRAGKQVHLGSFTTAEQAALAVARADAHNNDLPAASPCPVVKRATPPPRTAVATAAPAPAPASAAFAPTSASSTEHAQLVQRLEEHMTAHGLSQVRVAKAAKVSSSATVSMWLGCARNRLNAATEMETDALIATYLDAYIPPAPTFDASAASAAAPLVSSQHVQLVQRLKEHMAKKGLNQVRVAKAAGFSCQSRLSMWLGGAANSLLPAAAAEADALIAAYLDGKAAFGAAASTSSASAEAPVLPAATSTASAATPYLSSSERAQLMQRLEAHMAAHGTSQKQVVSAAGLSCHSRLCMWLGRAAQNTLRPTDTAETDALIAAYLDEAPVPLAAASASAATPNASASSSTEHAQLVQRLEKHMAAQDLSQARVAKALGLRSCDIVSRWLGCSRDRLTATTEAETDAQIAAYLNISEVMPNRKQRAPRDILASASASASASTSTSTSAFAPASASTSASTSAPHRDALPDGSYAVSHLIAERNLGTRRQFRVRWIGYSSAEDTWENARDILTPVLIEHFERLRDSCAGDVRTALRLQLDSLGARREQHERFLGVDGAAWLHKPGPHASSESAEDDSDVETAMRWWLSAQWTDEGAQQQPAQKCPKRPDGSQKQLLAALQAMIVRMGGSTDMVRRTHQQNLPAHQRH